MSFSVPTDFSNTSSANFTPVPPDNHIGLCIGVIDLGTHMESYQGAPPKAVRKIKLQFELPGVARDDGKAAIINATYNYSMHEKATFRQLLDGWLGNGWPDQNKGKSWDFLIGTPAMVNVEQGPSKREPAKTVSWIESVSKFPKGLPVPTASREPFFLSLDGKVLPENLSAYDAEKIRTSREYLAGGFRDSAPRPGDNGNGNGNGHANGGGQPAARTASNGAGYEAVKQAGRACPPDVAPLLGKYNLGWPYGVDEIPDQASDADLSILNKYGVPF